MKPDSLIQLIGSGNTTSVEQEWMRLIEAPEIALEQLVTYKAVLSELCRVGNTSRAEELAWSAVETISARYSPKETLTVAGPFLLAVGDSAELRLQVAELFRTGYADREGIDDLLGESGLAGGRPVRRALRTLDVCLNLKEGDFLAGRDGEEAVRIDEIDKATWRFTVTGAGGTETLGAVHLADRYAPAHATDFRVMRVFAPDELVKRLTDDPASVVVDICKEHGNNIDTNALEAVVVPDLLPEGNWKKWWTRARSALRKCPNIRIEGRSPCRIIYVDEPVALEDELVARFEGLHDLLAQLDLVEKYLRACKDRGEQPSTSALQRCAERSADNARRLTREGAAHAGLAWAITQRLATAAGDDRIPDEAIALIRTSKNLKALFQSIKSESLLELACSWLPMARPEDWTERLLALLPCFPLRGCDSAVRRLREAGRGAADFEPVVERIMGSPVEHFDALLWLWDGTSQAEQFPSPAPVTVLSRILRTLDECRRDEAVSREKQRRLAGRAKSVLSARKYERFTRCLEGLDAPMGNTLRNRIRRLDGLGRPVRAELLSRLDRRFPPKTSEPTVQPWMREDVLYVTESGLVRKQEEIEHHVNVKMKENAQAIGRAAEHGDLSENSEYKFALEERDLLRARLAQMNAEVAAARVIAPQDVPTDHVGIGTRVCFRRVDDGEPYEMTFLGPWEADAAKGRLNYKAPLAQRLMGLRVGDTVEFEHTGAVGRYEIVALENALASSLTTGDV